MTNYFDVAFTPTILDLQEQKGSREIYRDAADGSSAGWHDLDLDEQQMMNSRDSFYLATVGETGWPYVQHRGGDAGFVKLLGAHTIGWLERSGNRQYVGTGNIAANGRIAAIFVDYPTRTRLKIYGQATHHVAASPELVAQLGGDNSRNDGAITIDVVATNWNCPKYLTPRFTQGEIDLATAPLHNRIAELEAELAATSGQK
jgi:predicted pyridoxine 5'-phosphate oxidase superfamily flavin-nucleotide-binding protein